MELMSHNYWWLQMSQYVGQYVKTYNLSIQTKAQRHRPMGELQPLPIPKARWDTLSIDFIVELPESNSYDAVMNIVDLVSKCATSFPPTPPSLPLEPLRCI